MDKVLRVRWLRGIHAGVSVPMTEKLARYFEQIGTVEIMSDPTPVETPEDLRALTKPELVDLAERRGVEVRRADGGDGVPLKSDYVRALECTTA